MLKTKFHTNRHIKFHQQNEEKFNTFKPKFCGKYGAPLLYYDFNHTYVTAVIVR